jgi:hypothetical protein
VLLQRSEDGGRRLTPDTGGQCLGRDAPELAYTHTPSQHGTRRSDRPERDRKGKKRPRAARTRSIFWIRVILNSLLRLERYLALAREATANGDRIAAENFYQHAEHYFRINNARREGDQQGTPPRPTTPADVEMSSSEADSREVDVDRFQPQWDGEDSIFSETSTH